VFLQLDAPPTPRLKKAVRNGCGCFGATGMVDCSDFLMFGGGGQRL